MIAEVVQQVAQEIERTPAQVALNWLRDKNAIPIIGGTKVSQVQNNLACLDFELRDEHIGRLDEVSQINLGFPHDFLNKTKGVTFGGMFELIDNHRNRK